MYIFMILLDTYCVKPALSFGRFSMACWPVGACIAKNIKIFDKYAYFMY